MPELPEVQTVVNTLRPVLLEQQILGVDLRRADILTPMGWDLQSHLIGRSVIAIDRRGKRIVFTLDIGNRFYIHLGMTGRLTIEPADAPLLPHTHLLIAFDQTMTLRFRDPRRFGGIWWLGADISPDQNMGPEPLTMRPPQLARQLNRTQRAIKNALLDQSVVAGLGNIYVDESLFLAGIHPLAIAADLTTAQIARLNRSIKTTLRGNAGGFQKLHTVYDRADLPCRKCKTPIERIVLGGRSTHFCPRCQPRSAKSG
jgi:formamidopyrimidine-DNA glycosylase